MDSVSYQPGVRYSGKEQKAIKGKVNFKCCLGRDSGQEKDINNQLKNRNPVETAKARVQPTYDPKDSGSEPIPKISVVSH